MFPSGYEDVADEFLFDAPNRVTAATDLLPFEYKVFSEIFGDEVIVLLDVERFTLGFDGGEDLNGLLFES